MMKFDCCGYKICMDQVRNCKLKFATFDCVLIILPFVKFANSEMGHCNVSFARFAVYVSLCNVQFLFSCVFPEQLSASEQLAEQSLTVQVCHLWLCHEIFWMQRH